MGALGGRMREGRVVVGTSEVGEVVRGGLCVDGVRRIWGICLSSMSVCWGGRFW